MFIDRHYVDDSVSVMAVVVVFSSSGIEEANRADAGVAVIV